MDLLRSQDSDVSMVSLCGHKRKVELTDAGLAKRARFKKHSSNTEPDTSDSESSDTSSDADNDAYAEKCIPTPLTPISPKASPRYPSDLKTHHCPYDDCNKSFNRPARLAQHLQSHTNTRPFVCPHAPCTKDFLRESHLKHHVKSAHSNVRDYKCELEGCGKSFVTATRLRRHHAAHEGREKFRCTVISCGQTFRKHGTLQKHITSAHQDPHAFFCELLKPNGTKCGAGFDTEGRLKSHASRIHGSKTFLCTMCSSQQEKSNRNQDLGENGAAFPSYGALQAHIHSKHPPTCTECGLNCTSKSALKSHVEVIHGDLGVNQRRTHVCPEPDCGRAFTKRGNMNAHIQISHVGKKFICGAIDPKSLDHVGDWDGSDACGEVTASKGNLERHIRIVHLGLDGSGRFKRREKDNPPAGLALIRLTGSGYETESRRDIACLVQGCKYRFTRDYDLEIHLQSRHGLADFEIQGMMTEGELYSHPTLQGSWMFATGQDLEAERVLDMQSGEDVALKDTEDSLEAGAVERGNFWLSGEPFRVAESRDPWLQDEVAMQHLIAENYEGGDRKGNAAQDVNMIDPSLK